MVSVQSVPQIPRQLAATHEGVAAVFEMERALTIGEMAQSVERAHRRSAHVMPAVLFGSASGAMTLNVCMHGAQAAMAMSPLGAFGTIGLAGGIVALALRSISNILVPSFFDRRDNPSVPTQVTFEKLERTIRDSARSAMGLERAWLAVRADAVLAGLGYGPSDKARWREPAFNRLQDLPAVNVLRETSALWSTCTDAERDEGLDMLRCYGTGEGFDKLSTEGAALVQAAIASAVKISTDLA